MSTKILLEIERLEQQRFQIEQALDEERPPFLYPDDSFNLEETEERPDQACLLHSELQQHRPLSEVFEEQDLEQVDCQLLQLEELLDYLRDCPKEDSITTK